MADAPNTRITFTRFLFKILAGYEYVLLKHIAPSIEAVAEASDLDILVREHDVNNIIFIAQQFKGIEKWEESRKGSMIQLFIFFKDKTFLQVDFLYKFIRKNLTYLNADTIFKERIKNEENIFVYNNEQLFDHVLLFNLLNFSGLPKKYMAYFGQQTDAVQQQLFTYVNDKYQTNIRTLKDLEEYDENLRATIVKILHQSPDNKGGAKMKQGWEYFMDRFKAFRQDKGITITFSGVDGAGKSTILDKTKNILKNKYKKQVVVLRHRPQLLPILSSVKYGKKEAEKRAAEKMPRTGTNKSSVSSLIRFFYYYVDYIFGQFYIYFKYNMRGITVLYDRYYFDFIVDHRRSNISINPKIPRFLYRFVFKPNLNIFLYASPEVILQRKQELPSGDIVALTKKYKTLFEELDKKSKKRYIAVENIILDETLDTIFGAYLEISK